MRAIRWSVLLARMLAPSLLPLVAPRCIVVLRCAGFPGLQDRSSPPRYTHRCRATVATEVSLPASAERPCTIRRSESLERTQPVHRFLVGAWRLPPLCSHCRVTSVTDRTRRFWATRKTGLVTCAVFDRLTSGLRIKLARACSAWIDPAQPITPQPKRSFDRVRLS